MVCCSKCFKDIPKVDEKNLKIVCHVCERRVCVKCSGLLPMELQVIALQSPKLKYLCPNCKLGVRQLPALRKEIDELELEMDLLKKNQQTVNVKSVIGEIEEQQKGNSNVIKFGIPEISVPESTIEERTLPDAGVKQESLDVDQTGPDDVTTQMIDEGSEQHEMEDIKFVIGDVVEISQDYLDIGVTVISEQDRAISEHDSETPGPSSEGDVTCQTNIHNTKEISLFSGRKQCDIYGLLPSGGKLKEHMMTHKGKKPYKCDICDLKFDNLVKWKRHKRTLPGDKPSKCVICGYQCKPIGCFRAHFKSHKIDNWYHCEICDFKCRQRNNLEIHVRSHTGEKPYKCEICDSRFRQQPHLKDHMRRVHKKLPKLLKPFEIA